ncbi:LysR family transcriptional regulator [Micromonospora sp. NPDC050980]|uniref:LysR family transcriptional regulator n=1 Tax=Micromonospora sp. NPDC050980 TaxID=3155161 RepID=UPI0033BFBDDA
MELRHLRYAVALAEEGGFGRAAQRLHVSQPTLSVQIRKLEKLVGHDLFRRLPDGVRLTTAGEAFLPEARAALAAAERALTAAREGGVVRVGCLRSAWTTWELADAIAEASDGRVCSQVRTVAPEPGLIQLSAGQLDLLVGYDCRRSTDSAQPGVTRRPLFAEPAFVALDARHPLNRATVTLADFSAEVWLVLTDPADLADFVIRTCRRVGGFEPHVLAVSADEVVPALRDLKAVTLCSPLVRSRDGITALDLGLPTRRHLYLAWRHADDRAHAVAPTVAAATSALYHSHGQRVPAYRHWVAREGWTWSAVGEPD